MKTYNFVHKALLAFLFLSTIATSAFADEEFSPFARDKQPKKISFSVSWQAPFNAPLQKGSFVIHAEVPDNHHAYINSGDKGFYIPVAFDLSNLASKGYKAALIKSPEGEYEKEVGAQVFRARGDYAFTVEAPDSPFLPEALFPPVKASFQICNDETKICYPPASSLVYLFGDTDGLSFLKGSKKKISKLAPKPAIGFEKPKKQALSTPQPPPQATNVTEKVNQLYAQYSQNLFISFFIILIAGLLSAATPCVYPMLPITSAILMGRGGDDKKLGQLHTFTYFIGIVIVYAILGFVAGMTGGAFNLLMQSAFVNLFFAFFFLIFALAMLDFFDLSVGEGLVDNIYTSISKNNGLMSTCAMGMTAGLIISPCVGPVIFTILIQVADTIAEAHRIAIDQGQQLSLLDKSLIAGRGGFLMGGFGIGIGVPFLLVGLFSNKMPRSGTWMVYVKWGFGVLILYIAWIYYGKGIATAGMPAFKSYTLLVGIALLLASAKLGLFRTEPNAMKKGAAFLLLIPALYLGYTSLTGYETGTSHTTSIQGKRPVEIHENLQWHRDFTQAKAEAAQQNKPIFLDFYADWCANCIEFGKLSLSDKKLNTALLSAVLVKIYDTDPIFETFKNDPAHRELKLGLPYFAILRPNGDFFWKGTQYDAVDTISEKIKQASTNLAQK